MLNPREIATVIWAFILLFYVLRKRDVRIAIYKFIVALLNVLRNSAGITTIHYIILMFILIFHFEILSKEVIKDYIVWIVIGFFPIMTKVVTDSSVTTFGIMSGLFKFSIIPLFIINEYTLSLWAELILVPLSVLFTGMLFFSKRDPKYSAVNKLSNYILIILGAVVIFFAIEGFISSISDFRQVTFWHKMLIEIIGVLIHFPILFFNQMFSRYEQIIIRTRISKDLNKILAAFLIYKYCGFNKNQLQILQRKIGFHRINTVDELREELGNFKTNQ